MDDDEIECRSVSREEIARRGTCPLCGDGPDAHLPDDRIDDECRVDLEEMEYHRAAYDRATPAERRAVIDGVEEVDELALDPDERRARAIAANPDEIRDRERVGK